MMKKKRSQRFKRKFQRQPCATTEMSDEDTEMSDEATPSVMSTTFNSACSSPADGVTRSSSSSSPVEAVAPSSSSSSPSSANLVFLRVQGNVLYKQVLEGGFCLAIQTAKLAHALKLYKEALDASSTADEKASSCKNLGMLQWLFCKVELKSQLVVAGDGGHGKLNIDIKHLSVCKFHLFNAVGSLSEAREQGDKVKPQPWLDQLQNVMKSIVDWASEQSMLLSIPRSPLLQYVSQAFEDASLWSSSKLLAHRSYADAVFKEALSKRLQDESVDYKGCQSLLHFCAVSLRKAASCSLAEEEKEKVLLHEVQDLQDSVYVHLCICEAMQAIALGDACLLKTLMDDEEMDMEKVKDALDYYRQATLATRERDMETEAVAVSRVGKVYSDVLKLPEEAHKYHFQALRLALTVMSPSIARTEWYRYCSEKVKAHQAKVAADEKAKHEKDQEPARRRLEEEIEALDREAGKGAEAFLKHVYAKHPHPDLKRNVVPLVGKDKIKASLKKAILHYHPDSNGQHGEDWKVLCEAVCKHLNDKYSCLK